MVLKEGLSGRDKAEELKRRLGLMKAERKEFEPDWDLAQFFASSVSLSFESDQDDSGNRYELPERITSEPAGFKDVLVSGLCGYSINQNILWLKLGLEDEELAGRYGVKDWLEKCESRLYQSYNKSNLYAQIPMFIDSAVTFGHALLLVDENIVDGKTRFSYMNTPEMYIDTNEYDEVDTVFREYYMTAENAAAYFGLEKMSDEVKASWREDGGKNRKLRMLHAVYKNKTADGANTLKNFKYTSVFVDTDNNHIVKEGGYYDFPYAVFIWDKIPGKKYGLSPAMKAINDTNLQHKIEESRLRIAQMSADPVVNIPQKLTGTEQLMPGGRNYYSDPADLIFPVQTGANYPITLEITREMSERIKKWFHVDFFIMLQQQTRQMTATEVVELQGEKAAVLSGMVNNLNYALQKIVQRSFDILLRQGKLPDMPAALKEKGSPMKVDFLGVLAQAQKKAHQTSGIMQGIQIMGALAQMAQAIPQIQEAFDYVDAEGVLKRGFESVGVSQMVIREDDDVKAIRQARMLAQAQAAEREAMARQQEEIARNYNKLNEPVKPGSPAAALAGIEE
jgi:hypothetical protein